MRVLIIGLGSIARKHIAALRKIVPHGLELIALRSRVGAPEEAGIRNIFSWSALSEKPDFVLISNPTTKHAESIAAALDLSVPLFIEKPVLADLAQAKDLLEAIKKADVATYVGCNLRFHEPLVRVQKMLQTGALGRINEVNVYCGSDLSGWRPGVDFRQTYSAQPALGGGVHLDVIHELDYLYWFFGQPERVQALRRSRSHLAIEAIDYANYQLVYPGFVANVVLNYYRKDYKRQLEMVAENGTLVCDLTENTLIWQGEVIYQKEQKGFLDTYQKQLEYFLEAIQQQKQIDNDFQQGVEVLKIALA